MRLLLPLLLLACLWAHPALAWQQAPWQNKLLSVSTGLDYTHAWLPSGSRLLGPYDRAVPYFGLQTLQRPVAVDFRVSFDRSLDLGAGWAQPVHSYWNGWFVVTGMLWGRAAGREYQAKYNTAKSDHRFSFTLGPMLRAEFMGYGAAWSVFLELRQMVMEPVETSIGLGISFSPLAILQWRERY